MSDLHDAVTLALEGFERHWVRVLDPATLGAVLRTVHEPWSVPGREHLHQVLIEALESDADRVRAIVHEILGEAE